MRYRQTISDHTAIYHCMSRTVNGEPLFLKREKEILRKMILQVADFSGVEVLTYCVMSNHFHVLARISTCETVSDEELIRRFAALYPNPTDYQPATADDIRRILAAGGEAAEQTRSQLLARMGDVSQFMKTLKQRFSKWFNKSHDRFGPVWSDRFKSVLVEGKGFALQTVAAYIDLNPVRAGLVDDPKDYRFCGYAGAVAGEPGHAPAVRFMINGEGSLSTKECMAAYRQLLFGKGSAAADGAACISKDAALRVLEKQQGTLPITSLLRCRIRYFTEGAVFGSHEFVQSYAEAWKMGRRRKHAPDVHSFPCEENELTFLNAGRGKAFS